MSDPEKILAQKKWLKYEKAGKLTVSQHWEKIVVLQFAKTPKSAV